MELCAATEVDVRAAMVVDLHGARLINPMCVSFSQRCSDLKDEMVWSEDCVKWKHYGTELPYFQAAQGILNQWCDERDKENSVTVHQLTSSWSTSVHQLTSSSASSNPASGAFLKLTMKYRVLNLKKEALSREINELWSPLKYNAKDNLQEVLLHQLSEQPKIMSSDGNPKIILHQLTSSWYTSVHQLTSSSASLNPASRAFLKLTMKNRVLNLKKEALSREINDLWSPLKNNTKDNLQEVQQFISILH